MSKRSTGSSRRDFLQTSALGAGLFAAGSLTRTAASAADSPNEKLRVAVVGVRSRGKSHIGGFSGKSDSDVVAICDCQESIGRPAAESIKTKTGVDCRYEQDIRKLVEDPNIDVISIATPNHWHSLIAIWAMQNGKDVYVEKPVSHNVSEGRRAVQAARKYDKICQTGTQSRSNPGTRDAMKFMQDGGIGEVMIARGLCYKSRPSIGALVEPQDPPETMNYDLWCGPAPNELPRRNGKYGPVHYDWHWIWDYGNGDLGNQGIHQMDLARWGLGVEGVGTAVTSYGGRLGYDDAGETANTQVSIHEYDGNKRVVFEVRGLKTDALRGAKVGVIFYGREGSLVLNSYSGGIAYDAMGNQIKKFSGEADHYANFKAAVKARDTSILNADIEEGHRSSALCHLGNISLRLGAVKEFEEVQDALQDDPEAKATLARVKAHIEDNGVSLKKYPLHLGRRLELDGEVFKGNDVAEANSMLTRPYRDGFVVPTEAKL